MLKIYLVTGSFATSGKVGEVGVFSKLMLYYHEGVRKYKLGKESQSIAVHGDAPTNGRLGKPKYFLKNPPKLTTLLHG